MNAQMQTPAGTSGIPHMLEPSITDFQETECPKCRSMESALCSTVESAAQSRPQKRNHPGVKLLYAIVLVSSWSIVPLSAIYFVSVSYIRYHLEMPWILRYTDLELSIPAILLILTAIASLRYLWVRCTAVIDADTVWNREQHPSLLVEWERMRVCSACNHQWIPVAQKKDYNCGGQAEVG